MSQDEGAGAGGAGADADPKAAEERRRGPIEGALRAGCFVAFALVTLVGAGAVLVALTEERLPLVGVLGLVVAGALLLLLAYRVLIKSPSPSIATRLAFALVVVVLVAAIAIPNLIEARKGSGEASWIGALRTLTTAQALFREGDKDKDGVLDYAASLEELQRAKLIDQVLGSGTKQGYRFRIIRADEHRWAATASPVDTSRGDRWGFVDESGVIRFSTTGTATSTDSAIGG